LVPVEDGHDNYFVQTASSLGQIWTEAQWKGFRDWYNKHEKEGVKEEDGIPATVARWSENSWKKYFVKYVVDRNLFLVFPRVSLSTDFGDDGVHTRGMGSLLQVPLLMKTKRFQFSHMEDSSAVYDVFFEPTQETLKRHCPQLRAYPLQCDFYGTKRLSEVKAEYLISSKRTSSPIHQFGNEMVPPICNVICGVSGKFFSLARTKDFGALPRSRRLQMMYHQQRVLSGLSAFALGGYRFFILLRSMVRWGRKRERC